MGRDVAPLLHIILILSNTSLILFLKAATSAPVNRKKNERANTSYTLKQVKQEQKQRLNPTYMYILSDIYVFSVVDKKRPESYQSNVKNVILPKENQKNVNYFEESNNKLPTPIQQLEVIRRDCGELCNTSRDGSPGPYFNHAPGACCNPSLKAFVSSIP
jgi:hypothetical protein